MDRDNAFTHIYKSTKDLLVPVEAVLNTCQTIERFGKMEFRYDTQSIYNPITGEKKAYALNELYSLPYPFVVPISDYMGENATAEECAPLINVRLIYATRSAVPLEALDVIDNDPNLVLGMSYSNGSFVLRLDEIADVGTLEMVEFSDKFQADLRNASTDKEKQEIILNYNERYTLAECFVNKDKTVPLIIIDTLLNKWAVVFFTNSSMYQFINRSKLIILP